MQRLPKFRERQRYGQDPQPLRAAVLVPKPETSFDNSKRCTERRQRRKSKSRPGGAVPMCATQLLQSVAGALIAMCQAKHHRESSKAGGPRTCEGCVHRTIAQPTRDDCTCPAQPLTGLRPFPLRDIHFDNAIQRHFNRLQVFRHRNSARSSSAKPIPVRHAAKFHCAIFGIRARRYRPLAGRKRRSSLTSRTTTRKQPFLVKLIETGAIPPARSVPTKKS